MSGVTNTFSANTKIKASEVNQNFTDVYPTAWTDWTPTLESGATDFNFSTKVSRYCQIGKVVFFYVDFSGTVTTGSATKAQISLPVAAKAASQQENIGSGWFRQASGSIAPDVRPRIISSDTSNLELMQEDEASLILGSTFQANDKLFIRGFYEAA